MRYLQASRTQYEVFAESRNVIDKVYVATIIVRDRAN